ncbi:CBS domain-containing protein [Candidatus Woesearchaeota archaeon]|nr:CBS domain-containing protein [Candidatus Woesearchaeota archaeon]
MDSRSLEEIKKLRKKYEINQKELASRAGVSQSLIAKIEAGTVEPTYSKAQRIFQALEELREKQEPKAKEIMKTKIIFAHPKELVKEIIRQMKTKGISQMPVQDKGVILGIITEGLILKHIADYPEKLSHLTAEDVMGETPPIVSPKTGLKLLLELLKDYTIVLVAEKGHIQGIISKADVLGRIE